MLKQIKPSLFIVLMATLLAACSFPGGTTASTPTPGQQIENPYAPQAGDDALVRGSVEIVKTEMSTLESFPAKFSLKISFFTPTPCHQFRITESQPDASKRINVEVYSLMKNGQVCTLMRTQNPTEASLNLGSFPVGHYTVWVNGVKAVEFDS
jgi:hypothetical protein